MFIRVNMDNLKECSKLIPFILNREIRIKIEKMKINIVKKYLFISLVLKLNGMSFEHSFKLSILTLMNTVNSSIYGLDDINFNNLHFFTKYTLIFFMIVGRIELLTILLLLRKFLLKN